MTRGSTDDKKSSKSGGRSGRLAAALRENLRRRKAQERLRGAPSAPGPQTKAAAVPHDDENR